MWTVRMSFSLRNCADLTEIKNKCIAEIHKSKEEYVMIQSLKITQLKSFMTHT